jgi:hypothetical protein
MNMKDIGSVEECVAQLHVALYRLRVAGEIQEEYDTMGALISILSSDRDHMRRKFPELKI